MDTGIKAFHENHKVDIGVTTQEPTVGTAVSIGASIQNQPTRTHNQAGNDQDEEYSPRDDGYCNPWSPTNSRIFLNIIKNDILRKIRYYQLLDGDLNNLKH